MTPRPTAVLFDLDGTIVDSAPGILSTLAYTYEHLRMPVPPVEELMKWIGPPILESFRDFAGLDEDESRYALAIYRERYREVGVFEASAYPGVPEAIRVIQRAGLPISLATSKPESAAHAILDRIRLSDAFTEITGASEDETRSDKADVVAEALRRLAARGVDVRTRPLMIGDRVHDVEGAAEHLVPTIFVGWGYGAPEEAEGAVAVVETAGELLAALGL
ncbi:HAD hydrolase-like protein [Protaetiibacter mangrovi]|uniref:HAD hydrolase-like protein n=1 Tax=Protaetiibacter mangrovi TaxID=2970926 RepID=A0ABT1ZHE4_9MICO|nr:HAD hydrolase-like protein [Protaetiibacter mangrovi]MCS0500133.1 HAD hydrolase-like protein [Protaetiibacter mangrovi]TPX04009.1 HAD family hydrolase [Schumannella luteola]